MKLSLEKTITVGFGLALLILIVIGIVSYQSTNQLVESAGWVAHTNQVLEGLDDLLARITEAESGVRGYVITGEDGYLQPYEAALPSLDQTVQRLRQLTADNRNQQQRLDRLEPLIARRLDSFKQTVDLRKSQGFDAASRFVLTRQGKNLMDRIRSVIAEMDDEEAALLKQREEDNARTSEATKAVIWLGTLAAFVIVAAAYVIIQGGVAERKRAGQALRQSEERFSKAFLASPAGITMTQLSDGRFIEANDSYLRMMGYARGEVIGHTSLELGVFADPSERAQIIQTLRDRGSVRDLEIRVRTKSGGIRQVLTSLDVIDLDGNPCTLSMVYDITERKQAEEAIKQLNAELERQKAQLEAANKELESFSYSVSHDLRAPLRSIDGFSQALLEDYSDKLDADGQDYLRRVRSATQRMGQLIDDLLNLSRVTRGELHCERVDLSAMAWSIAAELQKTQPTRQVNFLIADGIVADGDARLLRVVLENLLGNAWKYTGCSRRSPTCARRSISRMRITKNGMAAAIRAS